MRSVLANSPNERPSISHGARNKVPRFTSLLRRPATFNLCIKSYNVARHGEHGFHFIKGEGSNKSGPHKIKTQISTDHIRGGYLRSQFLHLLTCVLRFRAVESSGRKASHKVILSVLFRGSPR
jgi:hypothetical protein